MNVEGDQASGWCHKLIFAGGKKEGMMAFSYQVQLYPKTLVLTFRQYIPRLLSTNFRPGKAHEAMKEPVTHEALSDACAAIMGAMASMRTKRTKLMSEGVMVAS